MKIICTVTFMLFMTIPILAQNNNLLSKDNLRIEALNSAGKLMPSILSEKQHLTEQTLVLGSYQYHLQQKLTIGQK